ncbi:hypothetical protein BGZ95_005906, partial [Linnemannia exigua]
MSFFGITFKVREAGALRRRAEHSSSVEHARNAAKATNHITTRTTTTRAANHKPTIPIALPQQHRNAVARDIGILAKPEEPGKPNP